MGGQSWIPFSQNLESHDPVDIEEHHLFNEMSPQFKQLVTPSATHGYNLFLKEWDQLVGD
jgi:hypothetical protein